MLLKEYLRLALTLPPHVTARKGAALLRRQLASRAGALRNLMRPTYASLADTGFAEPRLTPCFPSPTYEELFPHRDDILFLATRACRHEFNLLGSGWVKVEHGMDCKGLEGHRYIMPGPSDPQDGPGWLEKQINTANRQEALFRYGLIEGPYTPIDWQLDFKSGYRWSSLTQSHGIRYGHVLGADVKVPWELARMQHLPQLAWAYQLAKGGAEGFDEPELYLKEFSNQILDFIACNPPEYGVNWVCTMDVAIRVSNWLLSWNFFANAGGEYPAEFERTFFCSVYDHGRFIINHLEWSSYLRSNHYLSNIAGLLFVSSYLPESEETNSWLALSLDELARETPLQFNPDGSNFEASTCYHRLSGEILVYSTALVHLLATERITNSKSWSRKSLRHHGPGPLPPDSKGTYSLFSEEHFEKLQKIATFTSGLTAPDGAICQVGDNDSGRFLKLQPSLRSSENLPCPLEDSLDHRHLIAAIAGLLQSESLTATRTDSHLELAWLTRTSPDRKFASNPKKVSHEAAPTSVQNFSDFGVVIFRSKDLYLAFRCGSVGQIGNGGHAHNDQLSFFAAFKGVTFFVDPGTYLYTPLPGRRNEFRSTGKHNTVFVEGMEQNNWVEGRHGLFSLSKVARAEIVNWGEHHVTGRCASLRYSHSRTMKFSGGTISISDTFASNRSLKILCLQLAPGVKVMTKRSERTVRLRKGSVGLQLTTGLAPRVIDSSFSRGYGEVERSISLYFNFYDESIAWTIELL